MNIYFKLLAVCMSAGSVLFVSSAVVHYLKFLKNKYHFSWNFLDYISVGYFDHLVAKYIKRA